MIKLIIRVSDITADTLTVRLKVRNTGIKATEVLMRGKDMEETWERGDRLADKYIKIND